MKSTSVCGVVLLQVCVCDVAFIGLHASWLVVWWAGQSGLHWLGWVCFFDWLMLVGCGWFVGYSMAPPIPRGLGKRGPGQRAM